MKKKILSLCLIVALAATAVVGGTLAYFTDTEDAENVFTIGNVDVQLIESFYHRESAYMDEELPEEFEQYPAGTVVADDTILASSYVYEDYLKSKTLMPGLHINKMPYVKNTGNNNAYVRIRIMIPATLDVNFVNSSVFCTSAMSEGEFTRNPAYIAGEVIVNGKVVDNYAVYEFTRVEALEPGEMTYWNVWNTIALDPEVTNQDMETVIENGIASDLTFGVKVEVDAIQADSFADATEAWAAFDAQTTNSVSYEDYSADAKEGFLKNEVE